MANSKDKWVEQLHDWLMTPPTRAREESERKTMSKLTPEELDKIRKHPRGSWGPLLLDHIAVLEAENARLRETLQPLYDRLSMSYDPDDPDDGLSNELFLAKQALVAKPGTTCTHEMCRGANRCVLDTTKEGETGK